MKHAVLHVVAHLRIGGAGSPNKPCDVAVVTCVHTDVHIVEFRVEKDKRIRPTDEFEPKDINVTTLFYHTEINFDYNKLY